MGVHRSKSPTSGERRREPSGRLQSFIKELLVFQVMVAQKWLMKNELLLVTLLCSLLSLVGGSPSVANFGKRITSSLVAELGKRPKDMYAFGIGKRSISQDELEEILAEESKNVEHQDSTSEVDKRDPYAFGLGKRAGGEYSFGLGKKRDPYAFGLGKRANDMYSFGLGKKEDPYAFGLGKRAERYAFGLGKRDPYAFGLGKRDPYAFGLGKRDPYAFGLGRKRDPYSFGLGR